ncbi:MAG: phytanoyl-CoA dioxygenase family protein [Acidobacteriota bacterium]
MSNAAPLVVKRAPGGGVWIPSSLWIDRPDALRDIQARAAHGDLSTCDAELLRFFAEQGYCVFDMGVEPALLDAVQADVDRLWRERPRDVAYAYDGPARRLAEAEEARERRTRYRLHDIHSHAESAMRLYLLPRIHRLVDLMFGEPSVAIQSLYFEYGSQQTLHRDSVVVPTEEPGHLVAAWIALEDIEPDSGALVYVPGSHLLPCFETAPGEFMFDGRRMGGDVVERGLAFEAEQERRCGLEPKVFAAKKGQVLIWHGALRHGGSPVVDESLTRKSFVVHFSTRRTYRDRSLTVAEADGTSTVMGTRELVEAAGHVGFQNPMLGAPRG